jgi:DNA transformation protein
MTNESVSVDRLRNIGPTIARRLRQIGIRNAKDLRSVGAVAAYRRICAAHPGETIPVCYYLYSLEGALRGLHWDALSTKTKQALVAQALPEKRVRSPRGV